MAPTFEIQICLGSSCFSRGNKELVMFIREYLRKNHLDDRVAFRGIRCMGQCTNGPNLMINGRIVENVSLQAIEGILDRELSRLK